MILLVAAKGPVERAHRRVLDPSENVTPNNRYEFPMRIESLDRGFEIPIESQVGKNVTKKHLSKLNRLRDNKRRNGTRSPKLDLVTNLSSRLITMEEHHALPNALHHVCPSENFDHSQFVCNMEYFYA